MKPPYPFTDIIEPWGYYLYTIELLESGHFYIGVTSNPEKRAACHFNSIRDLLLNKKYRGRFTQKIGQPVHLFFADRILPKVAHLGTPGITIYHHYKFKVFDTCATAEEAREWESIYLEMVSGDPLCLNSVMKSCYW
jgi:hypothetical protein